MGFAIIVLCITRLIDIITLDHPVWFPLRRGHGMTKIHLGGLIIRILGLTLTLHDDIVPEFSLEVESLVQRLDSLHQMGVPKHWTMVGLIRRGLCDTPLDRASHKSVAQHTLDLYCVNA